MFCQKCGTRMEVYETACPNCNTGTQGVKYCHKCGGMMPKDAKGCGSCNTKAAIEVAFIHWLSIGICVLGFIALGILGGDLYLQEVNIFDYLTIPITLAGIAAGILTIPKYRLTLKITSIALNALILIGAIGWVLSN